MQRGFAFLPIIAIAIIGLIAGSTALSTLKERPGSALYGVQRTAEALPTNLFNYLSANYSGELKEKRTVEMKGILRSEGKEAATAFAQKEGVLDEKAGLDIAQYVPVMDGVKENIITVFRLTSPESVSQGKETLLLKGNRVAITGTDLVLEVAEKQVPGNSLAFMLLYENDTAEYGGERFKLISGGDAPVAASGNGMLFGAVGRCDGGRCVALRNPFLWTDYGWAFLSIYEPKNESTLIGHLVRDREYLGRDMISAMVNPAVFFGRYEVAYEKGDGFFRVKASEAPAKRFYVKVCEGVDYAANGTACGSGLKNVTVRLSDNGATPYAIYNLEMKKLDGGGEVVCADEGCDGNDTYVALFSTDGVEWGYENSVMRERTYGKDGRLARMYFDVFMGGQVRYLGMLLPEGRYGLNQDPNNPDMYYAVIDTANATASLEFELLSRRYVEGLNVYGDVYGLKGIDAGVYGDFQRDITSIFNDFYGVTGRIPKTQRIRIRATADPFDYNPSALAYYSGEFEGITLKPYWGWNNGTLCHELAHGLQGETGNVDLGPSFEEGFAQYFCVHLGYMEQGAYPPEYDFAKCVENDKEGHGLGYCVFNNLMKSGVSDGAFFRKLLDFPCEIKLYADLKTAAGKKLWYYVLSTAAGRGIEGFPHAAEEDYCAPLPPGPTKPARQAMEVRLGEAFTLAQGGVVRINESGDYVALPKLGERVSADFQAGPGDVLEVGGRKVAVKGIGRLWGNASLAAQGGYAASFALEFEVEGTKSYAYWHGSPATLVLNDVFIMILEVLEGNGRLVANIRLEVGEATGGIRLEYVESPHGGEPEGTNAMSVLVGQKVSVYGTDYDVEILGIDRGRKEAEIAVYHSAKNVLLSVEACVPSPPGLRIANMGPVPVPEGNAQVTDRAFKSVGSARVPQMPVGGRATVDVGGKLELGKEYYFQYLGSLSSFTC